MTTTAQSRAVFGANHEVDRLNRPIEDGRGSARNQTRQSVEAYRRHGKDEPDYKENLARMEKELAETNERRQRGEQ
jgi:hypothetical protein